MGCLDRLDAETLRKLEKSMEIIKAREAIDNIHCAYFPKMSLVNKRNYYRKLLKTAKDFEREDALSHEDFINKIKSQNECS